MALCQKLARQKNMRFEWALAAVRKLREESSNFYVINPDMSDWCYKTADHICNCLERDISLILEIALANAYTGMRRWRFFTSIKEPPKYERIEHTLQRREKMQFIPRCS
jgi:hypothetical protein